MLAHRGDKHLIGQLQEFFVEGAAYRKRHLHQVVDRIHQAFVDGDAAPGEPVHSSYRLLDGRHHLLPPQSGIDDHEALTQLLLVESDGLDGEALRRQETVATAGPARNDALVFEGNHLVAEHRHQPLDGSGEGMAVAAPAHRLGERNVEQQPMQELGEQGDGRHTGLAPAKHEVLAFGRVDHLQFLHRCAFRPGEALGGAGEPPLVVEASLFRGAEELLAGVFLHLRQPLNHQREPARRAHRPGGAAADMQLGRLVDKPLLQKAQGRFEKTGRDLLHSNFKE